MKYPFDPQTYTETIGAIIEHEKSQSAIITKMSQLLESAMSESDVFGGDWYKESELLLKELNSLHAYHETRRFNEANHKAQQPKERGGPITSLNSEAEDANFDLAQSEMSEDDLAKHFKEKPKKEKKEKTKHLKEMTLEEIESWEKQQENSNDIYRIKARVANLARGPGVSLTPQGEMLANQFTHVLKSLYDFANDLTDKNIKIQLTNLIRSHENMPGILIAAAGAGVNMKKEND